MGQQPPKDVKGTFYFIDVERSVAVDRAQWANNRRATETMPTGGVTT